MSDNAAAASPTYGGQALIEGVMIRGASNVSIAVRRSDGDILVETQPIGWRWVRTIRRVPLARGVIVLSEMLVIGTRALIFSANVAAEEREQPTDTSEPPHDEEDGKGGAPPLSSIAVAGSLAFSLIAAIALFFATPVFATRFLDSLLDTTNLWSNIIEGAIRLAMFVAYIAAIGLLPDIRRVFAYHGAEHMTIHAQEHNQPLTVSSIRQFSTAHPRCGTAFILVVLVVAIIVHVFWTPPDLLERVLSRIVVLPLIAGISYEIIRWSGFHSGNILVRAIIGPNLLLQSLTTRQPDDDQIEVAIHALDGAMEADRRAAQAPA